MTLLIASKTRFIPAKDYHVPIETHPHEPHALRVRPRKRRPLRGRQTIEATKLHINRGWLGLGAVASAVGLAGISLFGWPVIAAGGAFSIAALGHMLLGEPARPILERVTMRLPALPPELDGLRIGHLTDSHLGFRYSETNLAWGVEQMQRERPELIVLTGDIVTHHWAIPDVPRLLRGLRAPLGVYAVPGNHDHWEGLADLRAALTLANIPLLLNEHRRLSWNGGDLWLIGIDDVWDGRPSLRQALRGVPPHGFKLLLSHAPDVAESAAHVGIHVQLSGHTHGGHLRLPLLGPFTLPRYGKRYIIGEYQVDGLTLYVSRGLGGAPLRLLCPPEATIITLRRG
ncbi:metallophosphoesterase [Roseiflexus castenholzii]|uniref:Metallophosphoesterase n=1 Tax=Roseiflexus castenholzii (strain DSM 13941 / HLO8) TaxID=383372 RepID=A7NG34_ROSCS|nr:metallophosphoesterase [Roseiflexus castenholzii]ABU56421.1 metallophosphoesterase [Roseiflexus castenholzii DSM 13941]